jgi:hypothetical protein
MVVQEPNPLENVANITYLGFNQDQTCLAVGTWQGFMIFATENFALLHHEECGAVSLCEMLFRTSLLALAGYSLPGREAPSSSARQLTMWNTRERRSIVQLHFNSRIHSVKMNHRRVVVLLQPKIHIFDLKTMKSLHVIDRTTSQWADSSLGWLCASLERGYLATPLALAGSASLQGGHAWSSIHHAGGGGGAARTAAPDGNPQMSGTGPSPDMEPGLVTIVDTYTLKPIGTLLAHRTPIQALCLNPTGQLLATASTKGTVVRLFAVPSFDRLCTFRRGNTESLIHGLHFSRDSLFLCASAGTGTVHIFRNADKVLNALPLQSEEATVGAAQREMIISQVSPGSQTEDFRESEADEFPAEADCRDVEAEESNGWNVVFERPERVLERCNSWPKPQSPRHSSKITAQHALQTLSVASEFAAGYTAKYAKSLLQLLPTSCRELVDAVRAFAWVRLHEEEPSKVNRASGSRTGSYSRTQLGSGQATICHGGYIACITQKQRGSQGLEVMVASEHGCAHIYDCHPTTGGECRLRTEHSFTGQLIAKQHAHSRSAREPEASNDIFSEGEAFSAQDTA